MDVVCHPGPSYSLEKKHSSPQVAGGWILWELPFLEENHPLPGLYLPTRGSQHTIS